MSDNEVLEFLYNRMVNVYNENENYDYMIRFKDIMMKYDKIHDDSDFYRYLVEAGVDNWEGYDIAIDKYNERYK